MESTPVGVQTVRPAQTVTQIRIQTTAQPANAAANTRKGLSLTVCKNIYNIEKNHNYETITLFCVFVERTNVGSTRNV